MNQAYCPDSFRFASNGGCTDFPWIVEEPGYRKLVDLLDYHLPSISSEEKDQIMGGTALKIWFKK